MIDIRLIGDLMVTRDGEPVKLPNSRKTRALLAYLILNPGPHRRERLCEIFWQVPDNPRGALRWSLTKLRQLVDSEDDKRIVADRDTVAFDPDGAEIDILKLREKLADGPQALSTGERKASASTSSLRLAARASAEASRNSASSAVRLNVEVWAQAEKRSSRLSLSR